MESSLVASIHRNAESFNSRKLTLRIVQPYALGPGLWTVMPRSTTPGAGTLIHPRIKIRSRFPRRPQLVEKLDAGLIYGPKSGFRAPKRVFSTPDRGSEVDNGEFFNSLTSSRQFGE